MLCTLVLVSLQSDAEKSTKEEMARLKVRKYFIYIIFITILHAGNIQDTHFTGHSALFDILCWSHNWAEFFLIMKKN